jgi:hypothetical protein
MPSLLASTPLLPQRRSSNSAAIHLELFHITEEELASRKSLCISEGINQNNLIHVSLMMESIQDCKSSLYDSAGIPASWSLNLTPCAGHGWSGSAWHYIQALGCRIIRWADWSQSQHKSLLLKTVYFSFMVNIYDPAIIHVTFFAQHWVRVTPECDVQIYFILMRHAAIRPAIELL